MIAREVKTQRGHLQKQKSWRIQHNPAIRSKSPGSLLIQHHRLISSATPTIMNCSATWKTTQTVILHHVIIQQHRLRPLFNSVCTLIPCIYLT